MGNVVVSHPFRVRWLGWDRVPGALPRAMLSHPFGVKRRPGASINTPEFVFND
jgi:hypothetical protein